MGPRAMPDYNQPLQGLVRVKIQYHFLLPPATLNVPIKVDWSDAFKIDLAAQVVKLGNLDLGPSIVYRIAE